MDDTSFDSFVRAQLPSLTRYAVALTGSRHGAEDLVQETLVRVLGAWRRIRTDGNPAGYATTVMFRVFVSSRRTRHKAPPTVELTFDPPAADDRYGGVDARLTALRNLASLPRLQRAVLVATYLDDHSDDQIAEMIGNSVVNVRQLRHRGLKSLRQRLEPDGDSVDRGEANRGQHGIATA